MSKLEELIKELCPDGVEYKKIKDCFNRLKGTPITAGKMKEIEIKNGEIRVFAGGKTVINAKEEDIPNANITRVPAVLVQSRGVIDVVYFESPFTFKNEMWAYTHKEKATVKYLFYVLKNNIQGFRDSASGMGSLPQISLTVTEDFIIPLPPLPVQEEIVRILDNFTELTAELTAELIARKKQYEYYRDSLLTFGDEVEWKASNNFCDIGDGLHGTPRYDDSGEYYFVNGNNLSDGKITFDSKTKKINVDEYTRLKIDFAVNTILMSINGTIGNIAIYHGEKVVLGKSAAYFSIFSELLNIKFLYYYLQTTSAKNYFANNLTGSTIKNLGLKTLRGFKIPLPPLHEQQRIVDILDRFDTLCNDIAVGLPAEIMARKQQYEYYRESLLTFNKKEI